jgi:cytochrome P450
VFNMASDLALPALPAAPTRGPALPPGPSSRLLATVDFARDPYATFLRCREQYGDPFTLPMLGSQVVVTGRPELVKAMYALPSPDVGGLLGHLIPDILGSQSVLVKSGTDHADDRKLMMPLFHRERLAACSRTIATITREEMRKHTPGTPVLGYELGRAIALEVILRALFGVTDAARVPDFRKAVLRLAETASPAMIFSKALRKPFFGLGPWAKAQRAMADLDALFYAQIAARRADPHGDDMLGLLLEARYDDGQPMSDTAIRDQLMSLVLAGHETMAVTLSWGLHWILSDAEVRGRLTAEVDGADDDRVGMLPYLDAVCKETLRIYPIQPVVMRHCLKPVSFAGCTVPAGSFVGAATTLVHMDPAIYPEPERFRPERFLAGKSPSISEFFPFGGGVRRCIGAAFATQEMKLVLATLLREHHFVPTFEGTPRPVRQSTVTGPEGKVPLRYEGPRAGS